MTRWKRGYTVGLVLALLMVLGTEVVTTIRQQSQTWDEGDHLFAGYMGWKTKDFGINPEHPPMLKMIAAIPLLKLPLKVPTLRGRYFKDEAYADGRELLFGNQPAYSPDSLLFRARLMTMVFVLSLALLVFFAGREMFGTGAGLVAMTLLVFEPTVIAHGGYVTTDLALSCTLFATIYCFYRYVRRPTAARLILTGLASGLALGAKHSAVLLLPMMVVLAASEVWFADRQERRRIALQLTRALVVVTVIGVVVLWSFYGFRYAARPPGLKLNPSLAEYVVSMSPLSAKGVLLLGRLHILPESWLFGLADVQFMASWWPTYILGRVYSHGVWFYFPVVFAIKSTLGFLGLLALTIWAIGTGTLRQRREVWFLVVPALMYLMAAMGAHLNIGARHIMPLWVFGSVLAGGGAWALSQRDRRWGYGVAALVLAHVVSSALVYPNYIAYANEAWGGPTQTYKYLTDSNTDWGQQLIATKTYVDEHGIKECWMAYFVAPFVLPSDYGIPCKRLPTPDSWWAKEVLPVPAVIRGPVFISVGDLSGFEFGASELNLYEGFRAVKPSAVIRDGIFVYDGEFAVPAAAASGHTLQSIVLLEAGKVDTALAEAETAVQFNPGGLREEIAMGDALSKAGRRAEAQPHYVKALAVAKGIKGGGDKEWVPIVEKKMGGS